jgi:hypothetical protein
MYVPDWMIGMLLHCPRAYFKPYVCSPRQLAWGICRLIIIMYYILLQLQPAALYAEWGLSIASLKRLT